MKRAIALTAVVFALLFGLSVWKRHELFRRAAGMPAFTNTGGVERVETVTMRDGVKLHTELFLPEEAGAFPTILVRNPYEYLRPVERLTCQTMTRYGYACVLQDVRGQMDSEGDWRPIVHERDDGLDTLQWLVKQPFQDGHIAMRGPSYLTCTQLTVADALPPEVKTLVPSVFGTDLRKAVYERGLLHHDLLTAWATLMPERGMRQLAGTDYLKAAAHRPLIEADEKYMTRKVDWYRDTLAAESPEAPYWHTDEMNTFRTIPERATVPMLFVGGFFDPFFAAHLDTFERLGSKAQSTFVITPTNHLGLTSGDLDLSAAPGRLDQWPIMFEWFEHTLKGKPLTTLKPGTVRTFAVGDTDWVEHPVWPEPSVPVQIFHFSGAAGAQSCDGGVLGATLPAPDEAVSYTYDPGNPVPTQGGASLLSFAFFRNLGLTPGPVEQGKTCEREDVITFRSETFSKPTRLSGAGTLVLHVKSTAPDTAFVARLIAEQGGKSVLVRENAATLRWPKPGMTEPAPEGTVSEVEIDFWPIEWLLPAGGRWRVDITSSSFPALHTHSNRATPFQTETGFDVATQTVLLEGSTLTLPLH
ncbi:MAG: CocE/NonD family hydrolase [Myxococcaceae bacterium]